MRTELTLRRFNLSGTNFSGLHGRNESSAAILRAATAAELAANFAIRREFASNSKFDETFVDSMLIWANGIAGKIDRLLVPLTKGAVHHKTIAQLKPASVRINKKRNSVAHQGEFCSPKEAEAIIQQSREFIETLVRIYEPSFALQQIKP